MVEQKKSRQMAAENSIPRGKAQKAAPERRKGYFYLLLAAWWPTVKGQKWFARKGVRKRLQALEEPQLSARQYNNPQGNARYAIANARGTHDVLLEREKCSHRYPAEENCGSVSSTPALDSR